MQTIANCTSYFRIVPCQFTDIWCSFLCMKIFNHNVTCIVMIKGGLNVIQCIFYLPDNATQYFFLFLNNIYLTYFVITVFPIYTHVHHNLICCGLNYSTSLEKNRHVVTFYISLTSPEKQRRKMTSQTSKFWSFFIFFKEVYFTDRL